VLAIESSGDLDVGEERVGTEEVDGECIIKQQLE